MIYYLMLAAAAVLFSSMFLFNQKFQQSFGSSFKSAMTFSLYSALFGIIIIFAVNGFRLEFSAFSLLWAAVYAANGILYTYASVKSFDYVNLSVFSIFNMLGGMLLPSLFGILFLSEGISVQKILCYVLMIIALTFTVDSANSGGSKQKLKSGFWYFAVFVLNGLTGVISVIHQSGGQAVDSFSFLILARIVQAVVSAAFFAKSAKSMIKKTTAKTLFYSAGFAAFCGIGNLLTLLSLKVLDASVQYPVITGGTMLVSLLISILFKEKISKKNAVATLVAFASTLLVAI